MGAELAHEIVSKAALESVTDVELAFGTTRLLPAWDSIPYEFKRGNIYTRIVDSLFFADRPGTPLTEMAFSLDLRADLADDPKHWGPLISRCVYAHLCSFAPKHQHKIAGIAYMISQVCTISE